MAWPIVTTAAFRSWWSSLSLDAKAAVAHDIEVLRRIGPTLGRPHADHVHGSRHSNLKELRTRHRSRQWRVLFAFDSNRRGVLLSGAAKTSDKRAFSALMSHAEELFDQHLQTPPGDPPTEP